MTDETARPSNFYAPFHCAKCGELSRWDSIAGMNVHDRNAELWNAANPYHPPVRPKTS